MESLAQKMAWRSLNHVTLNLVQKIAQIASLVIGMIGVLAIAVMLALAIDTLLCTTISVANHV